MADETYDLEFNGYWREHNINSIPDTSGIYGVYTCVYNGNHVTLTRLIYIGESDNVRERIKAHEKRSDWQNELQEGEEICFNSTPVLSHAERERIKAAMIYKHKPVCNTEYIDEFPFDTTTINTSGMNSNMERRFTLHFILSEEIDANKEIPQTAKEFFARAGEHFDARDYDSTIADCSKAISLYRDFAEAWSRRAAAWNEKEEYDKALADLNIAVRLKPELVRAWYNRGCAWEGKGEYGRAIDDYNKALTLDPHDHDAIHSRASAMAMLSTEPERKTTKKRLEEEYRERLEEELKIATKQFLTDKKEFRDAYRWNMCWARLLRTLAALLLVGMAYGAYCGYQEISRIEIELAQANGGGKPDRIAFFSWMPVVVAISSPLFLLWWMLQRLGYEKETLAYGFHRKAILEERTPLYFLDDKETLKEMNKLHIIHWMEKSLLEVMLALGGKNKRTDGSKSPTESLSKILKNTAKKIKSSMVGTNSPPPT